MGGLVATGVDRRSRRASRGRRSSVQHAAVGAIAIIKYSSMFVTGTSPDAGMNPWYGGRQQSGFTKL